MRRTRNDRLGPDQGLRYLFWIALVWAVVLAGFFFVGRSEAAPLGIAWEDPLVEDCDCDTAGAEAPLLDGVSTQIEWRKNLGGYTPIALSARPLIPGATQRRTLNLANGVWRIRVVAYDDDGLRSPMCQEVIAVVMFGRIWWRGINET